MSSSDTCPSVSIQNNTNALRCGTKMRTESACPLHALHISWMRYQYSKHSTHSDMNAGRLYNSWSWYTNCGSDKLRLFFRSQCAVCCFHSTQTRRIYIARISARDVSNNLCAFLANKLDRDEQGLIGARLDGLGWKSGEHGQQVLPFSLSRSYLPATEPGKQSNRAGSQNNTNKQTDKLQAIQIFASVANVVADNNGNHETATATRNKSKLKQRPASKK